MALITGASSGIGAALARVFGRAGHDVVLSARREDRLRALAAELGPSARVVPADLRDADAPARLLAAAGPIDVLVNNAGLGAAGRFDRVDLERHLDVLRVNVMALTALTRLVLPDMVQRGRGRVLNIASTASFQPGPGIGVYCASKAFVLSLSEAVHAELAGTGVTVTAVCPGLTRSEFAEVAGLDTRLFRYAMTAEAVAEQAVAATLAGRRLLVTGTGNRLATLGVRLMPRATVLAIARRVMARAM
ncbi:MAG: SDR family oxidoreductase [Acidisphaera sp.]|nr:SDR family oxidoreductase [Acidisphaera sp.]